MQWATCEIGVREEVLRMRRNHSQCSRNVLTGRTFSFTFTSWLFFSTIFSLFNLAYPVVKGKREEAQRVGLLASIKRILTTWVLLDFFADLLGISQSLYKLIP
jgi:hypothetical protein